MTFTLQNVVPWGRTADEYQRMFDLRDQHLDAKILGCGDGPASFNAEWTDKIAREQRHGSVISCDPIYQFDVAQISQRFEEIYPIVIEQTRQNSDTFLWSEFASVEELGQRRRMAFNRFIADYASTHQRYIAAELPQLPFQDNSFDLALCSHFLFLYSGHFDLEFHIASLGELLRVAPEVRVFPLLALGNIPSPHLKPTIEALQSEYSIELLRVPYEFQRGGHTMLRLQRR